jgi:hypothetical protein
MATDEDRKYTALAGTMPLGSEKYSYDGDINAKPIFKELSPDHAIRLKNQFDALCLSGDLSPVCGLALLEEMRKTLLEKSSLNQSNPTTGGSQWTEADPPIIESGVVSENVKME